MVISHFRLPRSNVLPVKITLAWLLVLSTDSILFFFFRWVIFLPFLFFDTLDNLLFVHSHRFTCIYLEIEIIFFSETILEFVRYLIIFFNNHFNTIPDTISFIYLFIESNKKIDSHCFVFYTETYKKWYSREISLKRLIVIAIRFLFLFDLRLYW